MYDPVLDVCCKLIDPFDFWKNYFDNDLKTKYVCFWKYPEP